MTRSANQSHLLPLRAQPMGSLVYRPIWALLAQRYCTEAATEARGGEVKTKPAKAED